MAFGASAVIVAAAALAGAAAILRLRSRLAASEVENERLRDALWETREREGRTVALADGERALAQAQVQADAGARAKTRFLATVTHEMRTPLSGVIGMSDLLLGTALAPDQRTYARAVKSSAEAMLSLVDEILDLSRIDADKLVLQSAPVDVVGLVEELVELLAPRAQAKGLDLAVRIAPEVPATLLGDAARLRQILLNLAGNALKFTSRGGVGVRLDADGDGLRVSVQDTGPGFDEADVESLFQEFEQRGDGPAAGGVGLGLAISRRLAHAMGGSLSASARPGEGATFLLRLPIPAQADAPAVDAGGAALLAGRRILVVTNSPFSGPWLAEQLQDWGAETMLADDLSAAEMAETVRGFGADAALIDRPAPGAAAALTAAARTAGAGRALVLLSAAERHELPALAADGFDGYLIKPVRISSLAHRLSEPWNGVMARAGSQEPLALPRGDGLRVLVAEDDPVSALIAFAHLTRRGHSVVQVGDGLAARAAFEAGGFDAALIDIRMPGMDGHAVAKAIRALEAAADRPASLLLALSANVSPDDRAAALAAGMNGALAKPLDPDALERLLAPLERERLRVA